MKGQKVKIIMSGTVLFYVLSACSKVPRETLDETLAAIDSARIEQVELIYPEQIEDIKDSIAIILENIEVQKSKILFKDYSKQKEKLYKLTEQTNKLRHEAAQKKSSYSGDALGE
jgi:hypothetical protein